MTHPLTEAIAMAMQDAGERPYKNDLRARRMSDDFAAILATAAIEAIKDAGYAVVPVEPTEAMRQAAWVDAEASCSIYGDEARLSPRGAAVVYRAMIQAAEGERG